MDTAPKSRFDLKTLNKYLLFGALIIIAAGVAREIFIALTDTASSSPRLRRISLDTENSLPAWFSSILLFSNAAALALIALCAKAKKERDAIYWTILAWVFLFLSADEVASLHERTTEPFRHAFDASGFLFFAWVIPYGLAVLALMVFYARFLFRLPRQTLALFCLAGLTYLGGAIGMDMIGGVYAEQHSADHAVYVVSMVVEEILEIVGLSIFFIALRRHLAINYEMHTISVTR